MADRRYSDIYHHGPIDTSYPDTVRGIGRPVGDLVGGIAQFISNLFSDNPSRQELEAFDRLLAGVKMGIVDPDEALVQGTRGGKLYEKMFKTKPPKRPQNRYRQTGTEDITERVSEVPSLSTPSATAMQAERYKEMGSDVSRIQAKELADIVSRIVGGRPQAGRTTSSGDAILGDIETEQHYREKEPLGPILTERTKTVPKYEFRREGGFQPRNVDQLKSFVIHEMAAGRQVRPELIAAAGLQPKTMAGLLATDREAALQMQRIRNEPKMLSAYTRRLAELERAYPDADPLERQRQALADISSASGGAKEGSTDLGKSATTQSLAIKKSRAEVEAMGVAAKSKYYEDKIKLGQDKLSAQEQQDYVRNTTRQLDIISKATGGDLALAAQVMQQISAATGEDGRTDWNDVGVPDELKKRIQQQLDDKHALSRAKAFNLQTAAKFRGANAEAAIMNAQTNRARLGAQIEHWNGLMKIATENADSREYGQRVRTQMEVIKRQLADPKTREGGIKALAEFAADNFGAEVDAEGFQGLLAWATQGFLGGRPEIKGMQTPEQPKREPAPQVRQPFQIPREQGMFNTPRIVPPGSKAPAKPQTNAAPRTKEEFIEDFRRRMQGLGAR